MREKLTSEENLIIKILGLYIFAHSLAGVFLNLYLFNLGGLKAAVYLDLVALVLLFGTFVASGWALKKVSSKDLIFLGTLGSAIFFFLVFFLKEGSLNHLLSLGILSGVAGGCFWSGVNLSSYILTHEKTRNLFFGRENFVLNAASLLGPLLGGAVIKLTSLYAPVSLGYSLVFLLSGQVLSSTLWLARVLPTHTGVRFSLKHILVHRRRLSWRIVLGQQFLYGLWDVSFGTLSAVLIYLILRSEINLGVFNSLKTLAFAVFGLLAGRLLQKDYRWYRPAVFLSPLGLILFALNQNYLGLFSLVFVVGFFQPFLNIATSKLVYDAIDKVSEPWRQKYHFLVERDSALGLGRIINYLFLLWFFVGRDQVAVAKIWILIMPVFPFLIGLLQWYQDSNPYEVG